MLTKKTYYPACAIAFLAALSFGIITICQVYFLQDTYPVSKLWVGTDYTVVYNATQNLVHDVSLYKNIWLTIPEYMLEHMARLKDEIVTTASNTSRYCYPPLPAYLNYPLTMFTMQTASRIMFFLLIAAVLSAYVLISFSFKSIGSREKIIIILCGLIIIVLSHPFYFLIIRGHLSGMVFLLLAMGIYLLRKDNFLCSLCFALAISMIMFPALVLVPLLLFRRYAYFVATLVCCALLVLISADLWLEFFQTVLLNRIGTNVSPMDNCSLANTCTFLMLFLNKISSSLGLPRIPLSYAKGCALAVYGFMFCTMVFADIKIRKKNGAVDKDLEPVLILMYFPFMIAIPNTSFHYNLVLILLLVPAVCLLAQKFKGAVPALIIWILSSGIFLSQMQVRLLHSLISVKHYFFYFFPAFGLFLVMIGCVAFKLWFMKTDLQTARQVTVRKHAQSPPAHT